MEVTIPVNTTATVPLKHHAPCRFAAFLIAAVTVLSFLPAVFAVELTNLRCEYRVNPIGIDTRRPRLNWVLASDRRNQKQTAYQVLVASSLEILARDHGDLWDSGRVDSDQSVHVEYGGRPLTSEARCHWKVRVWDKDGQPSAWSAPASWAMGLLQPGDWRGQWIGATEQLRLDKTGTMTGYHAAEAAEARETKWVQVDLGREQILDAVTLHPPKPTGFEQVTGFGFPVRFRIEAANDPAFGQVRLIADQTQVDYPNPGDEPCTFAGGAARGRYVRVTATKLWNRATGARPFCFALAELEVAVGGSNAALQAPVQAKDSVEASGWGLLRLTDGAKYCPPAPPDPNDPGDAALLLRKELRVTQPVRRATAHICGLGYSELYVNGRKVGDHVLDPGFTDYSQRILYVTYNVTDHLQPGANGIGVQLGGGWYHLATPDLFGFERAPWTAPPKLLFQLTLEFTNGTTQTLVSDSSWKWSTGPITFNCVRGGETLDARLDKPGWNRPGYDDSAWNAPLVVKGPPGKLATQQHAPIRVTKLIAPIKLTEPKPGVHVFDLGVNIAGWARLKTSGSRGQKITLQYNELLNDDGTVNARNLASHTRGRFQTGEFILKGEGTEVFEPRFTYHGFRYVQVTGLTGKPDLASLTGCWVTTDPEPAGEFTCSDDRVNRIQELILRTQLNNLHGIPTDCPQREKMGWLDDGCVCMEEAIQNFDLPLFYTKWFHDMRDAQQANGHVPDFVPTCGWGQSKPGGAPGEMADPWWGGAIVLTPWKLYQYYADTRVLQEGYPAMKAYVDYLTSTAKAHMVPWGLGDWLDESAGGGGRRVPVAQTSTAAYSYYARIVSQAALLLGKNEDARKYADLADAIRAAFNANYLDLRTGLYAKDSQTAQALPLALNLAPDKAKALVLDQLVNSIRGPRQNHISAGIVGTLYLFHTLMDHRRDDLAWAMITQEDYPGWLNMINHGATSIWEAWNGGGSLNHPTFGCVGFWFYQGLAGLRPDPSGPGFKRIIIKPAIVGGLTWARARYDSIHGRIRSDWKRDGDQFTLNLAIPANTTATVFVPAQDAASVRESGRPAAQAEAVTFLRAEPGIAVFAVGSGNYSFVSTLPPRVEN